MIKTQSGQGSVRSILLLSLGILAGCSSPQNSTSGGQSKAQPGVSNPLSGLQNLFGGANSAPSGKSGQGAQPARATFNPFAPAAPGGQSPASKWPVIPALVPPPTIFVARADNCLAAADVPTSSAQNVKVDPAGPNRFVVKVSQVDRIGQKQLSDFWCWAACTQTILLQMNIRVSQQSLVQQYVPDPNPENQSAGLGVIIRALSPELEKQVEQTGQVPITFIPTTSDQMVDDLLAGNLCMVGLMQPDADGDGDSMGHACVVCGATFSKLKPSALASLTIATNPAAPTQSESLQSGLNPRYGLREVELFDPRDKKHLKLKPQDFCDQVVFITSHKIAHDILAYSMVHPRPAQAGEVVVKTKAASIQATQQQQLKKQQPQNNNTNNHPKPPPKKTDQDKK